jgi:hypothetical protein
MRHRQPARAASCCHNTRATHRCALPRFCRAVDPFVEICAREGVGVDDMRALARGARLALFPVLPSPPRVPAACVARGARVERASSRVTAALAHAASLALLLRRAPLLVDSAERRLPAAAREQAHAPRAAPPRWRPVVQSRWLARFAWCACDDAACAVRAAAHLRAPAPRSSTRAKRSRRRPWGLRWVR